MSTSQRIPVSKWRQELPHGSVQDDRIAAEVPVALTYNRVSHVVMMATPADLEDLGLGFSVTEGLIGGPEDLLATRIIPRHGGLELAMTISEHWFDRLATQRRNLAGRTGCGLCGAENIEQALRPPPAVGRRLVVTHGAMQQAVSALARHQPLQADTGATHGAAWCSLEGQVLQLREDVGRHNALDKLIGGLLRSGFEPSSGFALVSSRASYEMVSKAAAAGIEMLIAVSAPTTLAIDFAERSGITLVGFARPGRHNVYTCEERIADGETD
jgi:FdhD protein